MLEPRPPLPPALSLPSAPVAVLDVPLLDVPLLDVLRAGELLGVLRSVARGELTARMSLEHTGVAGEIASAMNEVIELEQRMCAELSRIATTVGEAGRLDERMPAGSFRGGWRCGVDAVNRLITNLVQPTTEVTKVIGAFASGDLSRTMALELDDRPLRGEFLRTARIVNDMVEQLGSFASEVTRVAREVGTEGKLGGQAQVKGGAGTWKDLTDNVNLMASNLTDHIRNIADVTRAVAKGDLGKKITVDVRGEILEQKDTINTMVDQLNAFAAEVTRVAREVGTEGKLGGQAQVVGAAGTWKDLTDNVNQLAGNLTTQVRAIADVATAVTMGDLTRSITVEASGEVAALKANLNEMIRNLKDSTQKTNQQDWLKTNLAKFTRMMQGQRDLATVAQQILSELTPLVSAQHGLFYIAETDGQGTSLKLLASYAASKRGAVASRIALGEGLIGQCAFDKTRLHLTTVPADHVKIETGLGESSPTSIAILPVLFEGKCNAVIELASFTQLSAIHTVFLDQLTESVGIVINTIGAGMRTECLLTQSQSLTQELQSQQEELRQTNERLERQATTLRDSEERLIQQQDQLRRTNEQLGEKAELLETKNHEVELAKQELEDKAAQLALTSKYKSEFLANMSHELRTPLNSLLILSKLLAENAPGNLQPKQVEFAKTIYGSGTDLLSLINDILDLSKIESGTMSVDVGDVPLADLRDHVHQNFSHIAQQKCLSFHVHLLGGLPRSITTDLKRLQQVLKNLLSNAFKFTERGSVVLDTKVATEGWSRDHELLSRADLVIAFSVTDTGIGIPHDKQRIIFEAFQQSDGTTSRKYGGTGLGLSISREIARLLGGELRVTSTPDAGSTFTLYLPRSYEQPSAATPPERAIAVVDLIPRKGSAADIPASLLTQKRVVHNYVVSDLPALDDRDDISPGDKVLLVVDDDISFARIVRDAARDHGFKVAIATLGEAGLGLARRMIPTAIVLDLILPDIDGWVVLDQLKHDSATRHIPVEVISIDDQRHRGLKMGARGWLTKPTSPEALATALDELARSAATAVKTLLLVEDNDRQRTSIMALIGDDGVHTTAVATGGEALAALDDRTFSCMVLDLGLPDMTGFELLAAIKAKPAHRDLPIIVYTGKDLSKKQEIELKRLAETIIIKDVKSPERLLDETAIYLHRRDASLPEEQRTVLRRLHQTAPTLAGITVLVIDDDLRNIFAISSALESHQATVLFAENGLDGLELLDRHPAIEVVLMDIMMPVMDGYEVMQRIRADERFRHLPIIALTAKAMRDDREKCIQAGASDYIAKPVDVDKLLSMLRVWLSR